MRNVTPARLIVWLSLIIAGIIAFFSFLMSIIWFEIIWVFPLFSFIIAFLSCFIVFRWGIRQFIEKKVRLIYRTIHNLKLDFKNEAQKVDLNEDVFSKIRKEVIEWDKSNRKEIERLTDQEKFRREFIGNISHELKTPIFNIQGYILTLLEGGLEDERINRIFLRKAEKSIDRMIEMVDDLDQISKLESNRIELSRQRFNLVELTNDVIESLEYKAKNRSINVHLSLIHI